jgi:hypothetical protein
METQRSIERSAELMGEHSNGPANTRVRTRPSSGRAPDFTVASTELDRAPDHRSGTAGARDRSGR